MQTCTTLLKKGRTLISNKQRKHFKLNVQCQKNPGNTKSAYWNKTIRGTTHKHQMTMIFFLSFQRARSYRDGRNEQKT